MSFRSIVRASIPAGQPSAHRWTVNHAKRAAAARDLARMARPLASSQTRNLERRDLMQYADVLDEEASAIERRAQDASSD